jgi:hypothetical protein
MGLKDLLVIEMGAWISFSLCLSLNVNGFERLYA